MRFLLLAVVSLIFSMQINSQTPAFPGAEGFGKYTTGGRGGDVYHVTNLNDNGAGSLRYGIESATGPRTIVFDISGTIMLNSRLKIEKSNITIAGQTAPGDGITVGGHTLQVYNDNLIVRYIRFRFSDISGETKDAVSIVSGKNIIFDHVTASWSVDETFSCQSDVADSITIQWCMITESLNNSVHEKGAHGYGGIIGSTRQTVHHNLYAHHTSRNPKITGRRHCEVDFRNNVIYNWGKQSCYDGTASYVNWANNYYKPGPATENNVKQRIFQISDADIEDGSSNRPEDSKTYETSFYIEGNYIYGNPVVTADNWNGGVDFDGGATEEKNRVKTPFAYPAITEQTAEEAYTLVLEGAGASYKRDTIDKRIVNEVKNGNFTYGTNGIIDSQKDVGGWPTLASAAAPTDTDQDGMPDDWENNNGLNPTDANDRNDKNEEGYTYLEVYLNSILNPSAPTSFASLSNLLEILCYPNPANENFYIDLRNIDRSTIEIYNLFGQLVYNTSAHKGIYNVNDHGLASGIYFIKVIADDNSIYTQRIIIE